jgi:hypothetical protein
MRTNSSSLDTTSKLEDQINHWLTKLDELAAKADVVGQRAKTATQKRIDEVKAQLDVARSKLDEAKVASAERWKYLQLELEKSWRDIEHAFQKLIN